MDARRLNAALMHSIMPSNCEQWAMANGADGRAAKKNFSKLQSPHKMAFEWLIFSYATAA